MLSLHAPSTLFFSGVISMVPGRAPTARVDKIRTFSSTDEHQRTQTQETLRISSPAAALTE
jgi:hypothetical protein